MTPENAHLLGRLAVALAKFGFPGSTAQAASRSRGVPEAGSSSGRNGTPGATSVGWWVMRSIGR